MPSDNIYDPTCPECVRLAINSVRSAAAYVDPRRPSNPGLPQDPIEALIQLVERARAPRQVRVEPLVITIDRNGIVSGAEPSLAAADIADIADRMFHSDRAPTRNGPTDPLPSVNAWNANHPPPGARVRWTDGGTTSEYVTIARAYLSAGKILVPVRRRGSLTSLTLPVSELEFVAPSLRHQARV